MNCWRWGGWSLQNPRGDGGWTEKTLALLVKATCGTRSRDVAYPTMTTSYLRSENEYEVDTAVAKMLAEPSCDELRLADDGCPHHPEMSRGGPGTSSIALSAGRAKPCQTSARSALLSPADQGVTKRVFKKPLTPTTGGLMFADASEECLVKSGIGRRGGVNTLVEMANRSARSVRESKQTGEITCPPCLESVECMNVPQRPKSI